MLRNILQTVFFATLLVIFVFSENNTFVYAQEGFPETEKKINTTEYNNDTIQNMNAIEKMPQQDSRGFILDDNFDHDVVISNFDIIDYRSMDKYDIQNFLKSWDSALSSYIDNTGKNAAQIIEEAANNYHINPKYLLVLLQKEQSLIESTVANQKQLDWATGYGVCDSCSKNDPSIQKYIGFKNQINFAAWRTRYYLNHKDQFTFKNDNTYIIDGIPVRISNDATRALYIYTPHIHGNLLFWKLWNRYFSTLFPDGSIIKSAQAPNIYLIENGKKRKFNQYSVFISRYTENQILYTSDSEIQKYPNGPDISYPPFTVIIDEFGTKYLITKNEVRKIKNDDVFFKIGYNPEELELAFSQEIQEMKQGSEISEASIYPLGALLRNKETAEVYYIENTTKRKILSAEILQNNFEFENIIDTEPEILKTFEDGPLILFRDGTLLKTPENPQVFIVSDQKLITIENETAFLERGYKWSDIITTSNDIISQYKIDNITLSPLRIWE